MDICILDTRIHENAPLIHASWIRIMGKNIIDTCIMDGILDTCIMDTCIMDTCIINFYIIDLCIIDSCIIGVEVEKEVLVNFA